MKYKILNCDNNHNVIHERACYEIVETQWPDTYELNQLNHFQWISFIYAPNASFSIQLVSYLNLSVRVLY